MCPATIGDKIRRKTTFRSIFATQKVGLGGGLHIYIYIKLWTCGWIVAKLGISLEPWTWLKICDTAIYGRDRKWKVMELYDSDCLETIQNSMARLYTLSLLLSYIESVFFKAFLVKFGNTSRVWFLINLASECPYLDVQGRVIYISIIMYIIQL